MPISLFIARDEPVTRAATDHLVEQIYDAAVDPAAWTGVMQGLKHLFHTEAETLYFLDYTSRTKEYVHIEGVSPAYMHLFPSLFYRDDNPCIRAPHLHRPGVVRTDEILCADLGDSGVLARSVYFNEWMRPQRLRHSMGVTPLAEGGRVLNLSLLRTGDAGAFDAEAQRRFAGIGRHLERSLRMALRLDTMSARRGLAAAALDALRHGVLLLREDGRVLHANRAAEAILRLGGGLALRAGRLRVDEPGAQAALETMLRRLGRPLREAGADMAPDSFSLRVDGRRLVLSGARLSGRCGRFLGGRPTVMLLIVDPRAELAGAGALMRRVYGFTPTEARLTSALLAGNSLRVAAEQSGMTYQTARWYLKVLFQKTGTSRQAELVAVLLGELGSVPLGMMDRL